MLQLAAAAVYNQNLKFRNATQARASVASKVTGEIHG
jgi:hypothetical protein